MFMHVLGRIMITFKGKVYLGRDIAISLKG